MAISASQTIKTSFAFGFVFLASTLAITGCSPKAHDDVVATIGPEAVKLSDYEKLYLKSGGGRENAAASSQEDREKFLDLMVKYRLKLSDAYRQGMDKRPEVAAEVHQYKGSLAASFITEREIVAPGVRHLYNLRKEEIRASHILISLAPDAPPADSVAAYQKAYGVIKAARSGLAFDSLALAQSSDPSVKQNKGDLYYFTAAQMVPQFEDAVFAMKPGEISAVPVRTQYGLHVIKVVDRKPSPGEIRCSHIMIRLNSQNPSPEDTLAAYKKIRAIQDSLAAGIDFADLAIRNSADPGSAPRGGDLGSFSRRRWILPFDEVAFTLKPGQISHIVRTVYGYHLIKCFEQRPPKSFEESKQEVQQVYQQLRFQEDYNQFVAKMKQEVQYARNDSVVARLLAACDSSKTMKDSVWAPGLTPALRAASILSFGGKPVSVDSIVEIIKNRSDLSGGSLRASAMLAALDKVGEQLAFTAKADLLEQKNPEFASILKEYKEGILLYQVEQERVWSKVTANDSLLRLYFASQRERFTFPDRVRFAELRITSEEAGLAVYKQLKEAKTFEQIAAADSVRMNLPAIFWGAFARGSAKPLGSALKSLSSVAGQLAADKTLKVHVVAHPDTGKHKMQNMRLATQRIGALTSHLTNKLGVPADRITSGSLLQESTPVSASDTLEIRIVGRLPHIIGRLEKNVLAPASDDRAKRVDSLAVGGYTAPFPDRNGFTLLRLDAKEPARQKTYEEAGAEVSTAFQDSESKRLENEWLNDLRRQSPVVEYKQLLKNAFAPTE